MGYFSYFFQNGERGAWQGFPHVPLIASLHPFFLVFPDSNYSIFAKHIQTALFLLK